MSVHSLFEKILKVDQLRTLKKRNLELQETFDNKVSSLSNECAANVNKLIFNLRSHSREQQQKLIESNILDLNSNVKNELQTSINLYQNLINDVTNCQSLKYVLTEIESDGINNFLSLSRGLSN